MEIDFSFKGNVTNLLWNNAIVSAKVGNPPNPPVTDLTQVRNLDGSNPGVDFYEIPITWSSDVPNTLLTSTISGLSNINIPSYQVNLKYNFTAEEGTVDNCQGGTIANNTVGLLYFFGPLIQTGLIEIQTAQTGNNSCNSQFFANISTGSYDISNFVSPGSSEQRLANFSLINAVNFFAYVESSTTSDNGNINNFILNLSIDIEVIVTCSGGRSTDQAPTIGNLDSDICLTTCSLSQNLTNCLPVYEQVCLKEKDSSDEYIVFGSTGCYDFFEKYIEDKGPDPRLDDLLTQLTQNVCACHLNPTIYKNLQEALEKDFPQSKLVAEPAECLFPPCPNFGLKSSQTGKICPLPACVNIAAINNNGTIKGGAKIIQDDKDCADITKSGSANSGGSGAVEDIKNWIEKHWVWLSLGVGLFIIFVIIVAIVLAADSGKK